MMTGKSKVFLTAGIVLLILLCGCEGAGREKIILVGSSGTESGNALECTKQQPSDGCLQQPVIMVYVCGAVVSPGVVEIPEHSRVEEALLAAGGFAENAAREAVNLAGWVSDGQMLYFPTVEEQAARQESAREDGAGLININTASAAQLSTLPGIGEARAADIIAYREANGSFESCEDIMKVSGIKTNVYEKICDRITVR